MREAPHLHIVADADWTEFLGAHGITPATIPYWRVTRPLFGDGAAPGAFYDPRTHTIHVRHSLRDNEALLIHEYGHAAKWDNHRHPRTILGGIKHAILVGFDTRAFTRLLRWFKPSKAHVYEYRLWRQILVQIQ